MEAPRPESNLWAWSERLVTLDLSRAAIAWQRATVGCLPWAWRETHSLAACPRRPRRPHRSLCPSDAHRCPGWPRFRSSPSSARSYSSLTAPKASASVEPNPTIQTIAIMIMNITPPPPAASRSHGEAASGPARALLFRAPCRANCEPAARGCPGSTRWRELRRSLGALSDTPRLLGCHRPRQPPRKALRPAADPSIVLVLWRRVSIRGGVSAEPVHIFKPPSDTRY